MNSRYQFDHIAPLNNLKYIIKHYPKLRPLIAVTICDKKVEKETRTKSDKPFIVGWLHTQGVYTLIYHDADNCQIEENETYQCIKSWFLEVARVNSISGSNNNDLVVQCLYPLEHSGCRTTVTVNIKVRAAEVFPFWICQRNQVHSPSVRTLFYAVNFD